MFRFRIFLNRNVPSFTPWNKKLNLDHAPSAFLYCVKESMAAGTPCTNLVFRLKKQKFILSVQYTWCPRAQESGATKFTH